MTVVSVNTKQSVKAITEFRLVRVVSTREWLELRRDPTLFVLLLVLPAFLMVFLGNTLGAAYEFLHPGGSRYAFSVSGFAICFSFYGAGFLALSLHRQATLGTLARLAPSRLGHRHVVLGEALLIGAVVVAQTLVLVVVGMVLFGVRPGQPAIVVAAAFLTGLWSVALGLLLARIARREMHVQQLSNVLVLIGGVLGGAIAPIELLPGWAGILHWVTPQYWLLLLMRRGLGLEVSGPPTIVVATGLAIVGGLTVAAAYRLLPWDRFYRVEVLAERGQA